MYYLGKRSMSELVGVHPYLSFMVIEAIKITKQDFMVFDGIRTEQEQRKLVERGVSKTMNSYHIWGLAVDLVPYVNGKPTWEEKYFREVADAVKKVIEEHDLPVEWGQDKWGWDMPHWQLTGFKDKYDIRKYKENK